MLKPRFLFVCVENAGRSQMAEGFARAYGKDGIEANSAGSKPSGKLNPTVVDAMKEAGVDISSQRSKGFDALPYKEYDYMVTMGCEDTCPIYPTKEMIGWKIEDPKGKTIEKVRKIRDEIKKKTEELIEKVLARP